MKNVEKTIDILTSEAELTTGTRRLLSLVCLLVSCIMVFIPYETTFLLIPVDTSIQPTIVSGMLGILILAPLYARNILKWSTTIYSILVLTMLLLIFSSLMQILMGDNMLNMMFIMAALVLSWLGIKAVAGLAWILVFIGIGITIVVNGLAMGFFGFVFIISAFLGILLHSNLSPSQLVGGLKEEFYISDKVKGQIAGDINSTRDVVSKIPISTAINTPKSTIENIPIEMIAEGTLKKTSDEVEVH